MLTNSQRMGRGAHKARGGCAFWSVVFTDSPWRPCTQNAYRDLLAAGIWPSTVAVDVNALKARTRSNA